MEKNVKADKMAAQEVVQLSSFNEGEAFSPSIQDVMLAQPLNTIRKLEFSVSPTQVQQS